MARRDFLPSVSDGLKTAIKDHVKSGFGSLRLTRKDKKTFARLFFKDGLIYGIEVSTYKPNIVTRIVTNEFISEANRTQVLNKFEKTLNDFSVVKFVVDYQLFPERPLATYIKDYFFDAFDEVFQWEDVSVEWKANDKLTGGGLTVAPTEPNDIIRRLEEREAILNNKLANAWAVHPRDFRSLPFVKNFEYNDPDYTKQMLLSLPENASLTIGAVAEYFGLPYFNTEIDIFDLWQAGAVDILHPRGMQFSNRSEQEIRESRENKPTSSIPVQEVASTDASVSALSTEQKAIALVEDEEETEFPPLIEESLVEEENEAQEVISFIEEEPSEEEVLSDDYDYNYAEDHSLEEEAISLTTSIEEEPATSSFGSEFGEEDEEEYNYTPDEDADFYSEEETSTQNSNLLEEQEDMSDSGTGLSAIAQQMKALISEIKGKMNEAKANVLRQEKTISEKSAKRRELIAQLRAIDAELASAKEKRTEAIESLETLETEFNEFTQLLK